MVNHHFMKRRVYLISCMLLLLAGSIRGQTIELVKDINSSGGSYPKNFTVLNNKLFFVAADNASANHLYVSDGTAGSADLLGPSAGLFNSLTNLVAFNNKIYFSFSDGVTGAELWVSDGTTGGTTLLKDIYPGAANASPRYFTVANNKLFFMAENAAGERGLFVSDGTAAGTVLLKNFIDMFNGANSLAILNNNIYFRGDDGTGYGYGLWKSDGTPGGTVLVKAGIVAGTTSGTAVLNSKLYFAADDNTYGNELWVTDGTGAGTHLVKNLSADGGGVFGNGSPQNLVVYNSKIYFAGRDDTHGMELFVTDGTDAGTQLVKDIFPGTTGSLPYQLTVYNGLLYIDCWGTDELWKSDGTDAGTLLVKATPSSSRFVANWNNKMYLFSGSFYTLYESDGTTAGTKAATAANTSYAITAYSTDYLFTTFNDALYFSGSCYLVTTGFEPVKLVADAASVTTYTFTGSGNWSNPANWSGGLVPPATLPSGKNIVITGTCILDVTQHVAAGASITVATGAILVITGSLNIT